MKAKVRDSGVSNDQCSSPSARKSCVLATPLPNHGIPVEVISEVFLSCCVLLCILAECRPHWRRGWYSRIGTVRRESFRRRGLRRCSSRHGPTITPRHDRVSRNRGVSPIAEDSRVPLKRLSGQTKGESAKIPHGLPRRALVGSPCHC